MIFYESPLKIEFTHDGLVVDGKKKDYSARMLSELKEVLMEPVPFKEDKPIYLMYRDVYNSQDIRFDITVIASRILGKEYARTYGHHHPFAEKDLTYPEIYQVLFGNASFILQKESKDGSSEVIIISAAEKDILLIPPGYGHVTINPNMEEPLFLANLVSTKFQSSYEKYKENQGPAVYYTEDGLIQNTNYIIKNIERTKTKDLNQKYGFVCSDMLKEFTEGPDKFEFLNKPSLLFK